LLVALGTVRRAACSSTRPGSGNPSDLADLHPRARYSKVTLTLKHARRAELVYKQKYG